MKHWKGKEQRAKRKKTERKRREKTEDNNNKQKEAYFVNSRLEMCSNRAKHDPIPVFDTLIASIEASCSSANNLSISNLNLSARNILCIKNI